ncbi:MAG: DUF1761 domain-containing protein [Oligoflexia bacterium]|nr:DUF1761 domain-containing protein [Oligoflexia bacterium]
MVEPKLIINFYAILASIGAGMVFGFLWYGPIFGKAWAKGMGLSSSFAPSKKQMQKAMVLQVIGLFLMAYVLAHSGQIWRPSVWGLGEDGGSPLTWGFMSAFFTWLGFYVPMQFSKVAWENRPWKIFFINAGHDFLNLFIISTILAYWR